MLNFNWSFISKNRIEILIGLSLIPLLYKSISYILIGGFWPLSVFAFFGILLLVALKNNSRYKRLAVKVWAIVIILWGTARIGLMILFLGTSVQEGHVESQFTLSYILTTLIYILGAIYILKTTTKYLVSE